MARLEFTKGALKALKGPPGGRDTYFDSRGSGLGFRVSGPNKRHPKADLKVFGVPYRRGKVQRWYTLRPDFPILSLREAEKQAIQVLAKVSLGEDPAADRAQARATPAVQLHTMGSVAKAFCEVLPDRRHPKTGRLLSAKHVESTTRYLQRAADHWGGQDIRMIEEGSVREFLEAIGKTHLVTANRVHAALRTMFGWAAERGIVARGTLTGLRRVGSERARDRVLGSDEIASVWAGALTLGYPYSPFVRALLAGGQRLGETSRLRWRHIKDDTWLLPAAEAKNDRASSVPLSSLFREILTECPQIIDGFVFAGRNPRRPITSFGGLKARLDEKIAELRRAQGKPPIEPWTLHDLRRTMATSMGGLGVDPRIIQKILNHVDETVTGKVYNLHRYDVEKREALELWARRLRSLTEPPPDNIEAFPKRRAS